MPSPRHNPGTSAPRRASAADFEAWLSLACEVEHLFGPMAREASFRAALREAIDEARAYCIDHELGGLAGGVVISTAGNRIDWLAVSARTRGRGLGDALLGTALSLLDPGRPISVQTFDSTTAEGLPARGLYRKHGFLDDRPCGPTPAGVPTVLMVRPCPVTPCEEACP